MMLERYEKAALNDLKYIQRLIEENPDIIDVPYKKTLEDKHYMTEQENNISLILGMPLVGYALFAPTFCTPVGGVVALLAMVSAINLAIEKSRENWTLLEFAAETGATAVAVYLILQGASVKNQYIKIAEEGGYKDFVLTCQACLERRAKTLVKENDIKEIEDLKNDLIDAVDEIERRDLEIDRLMAQFVAIEELISGNAHKRESCIEKINYTLPATDRLGCANGALDMQAAGASRKMLGVDSNTVQRASKTGFYSHKSNTTKTLTNHQADADEMSDALSRNKNPL